MRNHITVARLHAAGRILFLKLRQDIALREQAAVALLCRLRPAAFLSAAGQRALQSNREARFPQCNNQLCRVSIHPLAPCRK